jgi:hypothetical protein
MDAFEDIRHVTPANWRCQGVAINYVLYGSVSRKKLYWQFTCVISQKFKKRFVVITGMNDDTIDAGIRAVSYGRTDCTANRVAKYEHMFKIIVFSTLQTNL